MQKKFSNELQFITLVRLGLILKLKIITTNLSVLRLFIMNRINTTNQRKSNYILKFRD